MQMSQENILAEQLNRKLALVEIEKKLIELSCSLISDEIYSTEDAVDALLKVIDLIKLERQVITSDIRSTPKWNL